MTITTDAQARAELTRLCAAAAAPALVEADLDALVALSKRELEGVTLYDRLNAAAAEGWRRKAGYAAALVNWTADGSTYNEQQAFSNAMSMVALYEGRATKDEATTPGPEVVDAGVPFSFDTTYDPRPYGTTDVHEDWRAVIERW